jgi:hypothetical protein
MAPLAGCHAENAWRGFYGVAIGMKNGWPICVAHPGGSIDGAFNLSFRSAGGTACFKRARHKRPHSRVRPLSLLFGYEARAGSAERRSLLDLPIGELEVLDDHLGDDFLLVVGERAAQTADAREPFS